MHGTTRIDNEQIKRYLLLKFLIKNIAQKYRWHADRWHGEKLGWLKAVLGLRVELLDLTWMEVTPDKEERRRPHVELPAGDPDEHRVGLQVSSMPRLR